jgi:hypothetical protein
VVVCAWLCVYPTVVETDLRLSSVMKAVEVVAVGNDSTGSSGSFVIDSEDGMLLLESFVT